MENKAKQLLKVCNLFFLKNDLLALCKKKKFNFYKKNLGRNEVRLIGGMYFSAGNSKCYMNYPSIIQTNSRHKRLSSRLKGNI